MDNGFEVLNREQDLDIAEKSIASNLKLLEAVMQSDPENEHFMLLACMGYSSYALAFVEDATPERATVFYLRSRDYGLQILKNNKKFAEAFNKDLPEFEESLNSFSEEDVPAVFWTAVGWGSYIYLNISNPEAVSDLSRVEAMMNFVVKKKPDYFYGGAHYFLGTLAGTMPKVLGGNPDVSRRHFEEALKYGSGKFLMTYVYFARSYAVQAQDKALFENCLTTVDTTSIDVLPEMRLSNAVAKKKAVILRDKISDYFLDEEPVDDSLQDQDEPAPADSTQQ